MKKCQDKDCPYKQGGYLTSENAHKAMRLGKICWHGITEKNCAKCGEDISWARVVEVKTAHQYLKGL